MNNTLPELPYAYNALEPFIDEQTMRLHHEIHHQGYVNGLNKALEQLTELKDKQDYEMIKHWERELSFHGSGHILHCLFWENMNPTKTMPKTQLKTLIDEQYGSFENFKTHFISSAAKVEGSGWGILAFEPFGEKLLILQAEKHQNQTLWNTLPLLVVDVWEHAYYLKYQNKRKAYLDAFFNIINWDVVSKRLKNALD
ncbi:superoxide dismutase [Costertonia aggregata]|uniref:Superoxide dismutase n=1 Tax=Costertonia aggregata TaxID=343403 RepID=A0A7H9AW56_9FLAO|nr:superoxide dismutase [Costertonia aggregata]